MAIPSDMNWLDVDAEDDESVYFGARQATVKRYFDRFGDGYSFEEDTSQNGNFKGQIWKLPPSADHPISFAPGVRVDIKLSMKRKQNKPGEWFYNLDSIDRSEAESPPQRASETAAGARELNPAQDGPPAEWLLPIDYHREKAKQERASIERQVVFKGLGEALPHLIPLIEADVITKGGAKRVFEHWKELADYLRNRHGAYDAIGDRPDQEEIPEDF